MNYRELEALCNKHRICIWGYGLYGKTYAYLALKCAGARMVFYCDKNYREDESFEGISLKSKETLFKNTDTFVLIAMKDIEQQKNVMRELESNKMGCAVFDQNSFSELCESIVTSNDEMVLKKYSDIVDDKKFLSIMYKCRLGVIPNFEKPSTFNEKLQCLKLIDRREIYTKFVDKYEVKNIVSKIIGEDHIIPTLGVWDSVDEIDFDKLPDKFVLKCTHDSGSAIICSGKKNFSCSVAKEKLAKAMNTNFYWLCREYPYKNVRPRVIAEEKLESGCVEGLKDYKVFSFNGEPRIIQVDYDRFSNHSRAMYSTDWKYLGFSTEYPLHKEIDPKPEELEEILDYTRKLSAGIPHVRVDFYIVNQKVYFGEMTFYHGSGFELFTDEAWNNNMGHMIDYC